MSKQPNPLSRKSDLLTRELTGEVLIYDLLVSKAYCLNETSATIWQLCDGSRSIGEIKAAANKKLKSSISDDFVRFALAQFEEKNLLQNAGQIDFGFGNISRREAARRIGLGAMIALPIITSLTAPASIAAQSSCTIGNSCSCSVSNPVNATTGVNCRTLGGTPTGCGAALTCDCLVTAGSTQGSCAGV